MTPGRDPRIPGYAITPDPDLSLAGLVRLWIAIALVRGGLKVAPVRVRRVEAPADHDAAPLERRTW